MFKATIETLEKDIYVLTMKTSERCQSCSSGVIFNNWTYFTPFSAVSVVDFEPVFVCWNNKLLQLINLLNQNITIFDIGTIY